MTESPTVPRLLLIGSHTFNTSHTDTDTTESPPEVKQNQIYNPITVHNHQLYKTPSSVVRQAYNVSDAKRTGSFGVIGYVTGTAAVGLGGERDPKAHASNAKFDLNP